MQPTGFPLRILVVTVTALALHCGGAGPTQGPQVEDQVRCSGSDDCAKTAQTATSSNWHPDPDGDGIPSATDHCPDIYDVDQGDADGDGVGDYCDPDFTTLVQGGPVVDLRAEHVTPYGGWFGFTSTKTTRYGQDYLMAWSDKRADLATGKAMGALPGSHKFVFRVFAYARQPLAQPLIITSMDPKKKYYVAVTPLDDNDRPTNKIGNIAEITTAADVTLAVPGPGPRVWLTPEQRKVLRDREKNGDRSWKKWASIMGPSVLDAARSGSQYDFGKCLSAALLFQGTDSAKYKSAALTIIESMRAFWQSNELKNNQLRWADSNLAICAGLMWDELSDKQRAAIVAAYLEDDEAANIERKVDTDEFASIARTWIIDGLVGCNAPGLSAPLSARACALLDRGKRAFYGVQLVKARRNHGFFAQSGGNLPDGNGYGLGTSSYWLQTLYALGNVGGEVDAYVPWVWHNLQAMQIQALTPKRRGLASFGDLDSYDNFSVEPNSLPIPPYNGGLVAMHMGLLERAGQLEQASHARWHLDNLYPDDDFGGTWAMLLFAHDGLKARGNQDGVPTSFLDASMGLFYDRTDWGEQASFFTFHAGWSGADHAHEDAGSFQLYRNGEWLTQENLGYDGPASQAQGHNVPLLEISFEDQGNRVGQFNLVPAKPAQIRQAIASETHAFVAADLVGAYSSGRYHSFLYDEVEREILWLKPTKNNTDDRLIVYDRIVSKPGARKGTRAWQLQINTEPEVSGARATFKSQSHVDVQVVLPAKLTLKYEAPQGKHSQYPGQRYTGRLVGDAGSTEGTVQYLAVVRASDAPSQDTVVAVESSDVVGALLGTELAVFSKTITTAGNAARSVSVKAKVPLAVWWTGLRPNSGYELRTTVVGETQTITVTPGGAHMTDGAGVLVAKSAP